MATHEQNIENLRTATYGEQVRGSMIELFEEDYNLVKDGVGVGTDISSVSDPTTGFSDGAVYINSDSWHVFKLEGTAWVDHGEIKGDKGESVVEAYDNGDGTFYLIMSDGTHTSDIATIRGLQGPQGPQGIQGPTGAAGRSVSSMTMSGTGKQHQIIATYSDGVSQTVGVVQDGADGSGTGDMSKSTYDVDDRGYVDAAAAITDGVNIIPYSTIAGKADAATTLAGYGIEDAYTDDETDEVIADSIASAVENLYSTSDAVATTLAASDTIPFLQAASSEKKNITWSNFASKTIGSVLHSYATYNPDNLTTFGVWAVKIEAANSPTGSTAYGVIAVFQVSSSSSVGQIFISSNNVMWFRYRNTPESAWTAWKESSYPKVITVTFTNASAVTVPANGSASVALTTSTNLTGYTLMGITSYNIWNGDYARGLVVKQVSTTSMNVYDFSGTYGGQTIPAGKAVLTANYIRTS